MNRLSHYFTELLTERAYHGTGAKTKFEKFNLTFLGDGEGAQAYGYGLYFTATKAIAEEYRDRLSDHQSNRYSWNGKELDGLEKHVASQIIESGITDVRKRWIKFAKEEADNGGHMNPDIEKDYFKKGVEVINQMKSKRNLELRQGRVYTVDINLLQNDLLDWDNKLDGQHWKMMNAFEKTLGWDLTEPPSGAFRILNAAIKNPTPDAVAMTIDNDKELYDAGVKLLGDTDQPGEDLVEKYYDWVLSKTITGGQAYEILGGGTYEDRIGKTDNQKNASEALLKRGIKGIKYMDQFTREGLGFKSYNYVIFNEDDVVIEDTE